MSLLAGVGNTRGYLSAFGFDAFVTKFAVVSGRIGPGSFHVHVQYDGMKMPGL